MQSVQLSEASNRQWLIILALVALFALSCGGRDDSTGADSEAGGRMDTPSGATLEHGERGGSADHDQRRTVESADVQSRGSTRTPTPTAEPVTPTVSPTILPEPTIWYPTLAPSLSVVAPTVAPAAPVFAGSACMAAASVYDWPLWEVQYVMDHESFGGDPYALNRSSGACGCMQTLPCVGHGDPAANMAEAYAKWVGGGRSFEPAWYRWWN